MILYEVLTPTLIQLVASRLCQAHYRISAASAMEVFLLATAGLKLQCIRLRGLYWHRNWI